jgi:hypothetical protein
MHLGKALLQQAADADADESIGHQTPFDGSDGNFCDVRHAGNTHRRAAWINVAPSASAALRGSLLHDDCAPTERARPRAASRCALSQPMRRIGRKPLMKIVLWIIFIIFLIGLAVVLGLGKLIF